MREREFRMQNEDVRKTMQLSLAILGLASFKPASVVDDIREAINQLFSELDLPEYTPQVPKSLHLKKK